jgi:hypothetical protein
MYTKIIISADLSTTSNDVIDTKDSIMSYVGGRMIANSCDGYPQLLLNCGLDAIDKNNIKALVQSKIQKSLTIFIESDKELNEDVLYFSV